MIQQQDDVYFLDSDDDIPDRKSQPEVGGDDRAGLSLEEDVDLQRARVSMMCNTALYRKSGNRCKNIFVVGGRCTITNLTIMHAHY